MRKKSFYSVAIVLLTILFFVIEEYVLTEPENRTPVEENDPEPGEGINTFYLPTSTTRQVVHHNYYSLSYDEAHEQAEWVAYELKKAHLSQNNIKRPYFIEDPKLRSRSADWRNYKNSGYDRGHLCPAGDRRFSVPAYNETFYTSNVTPQKHSFNSGIWNRLEQKSRYWAKKYDGIFVVTGGILNKELKTIGKEGVSVPEYFYKVLLDNQNGNYKIIGFLIPHEESSSSLEDFVVPVDRIEELTGIDFFTKLDDRIEEKLESINGSSDWF
ncbi:DNA/RNA non-specific endonuclease [Leptobacterium flavescens]|uniref:Endonuclease n=1 Tax=Leptobacterium flavescens TaxID=472055 RepID=A0A6P0UWI5_9FLAO|nr:DNA/RNA non-specific endonuclease [Leptobacterium flavescens]NER14796.1 DNA/RNA non-specific endonuclease [Leptobacterium flavescens]